MAGDKQQALTRESCYDYVYNKIFPLRPADYGQRHPNWPGLVGLEVEMLPLWGRSLDSSHPETVPLFADKGLVSVLEGLKKTQPLWTYNYLPEDLSHLLTISLDDSDMVSFEPGGQLEFSTRPYPCLGEAITRMQNIQAVLDRAAEQAGIQILQVGMNPWLTVDEIGLQMTKSRYAAMDAYFTLHNGFGRRMMRQTCTIQVNLDFGADEETLAKRYLLSNLLAPFATAIFANSPMVDGSANGYLSNRARTWQQMDPSRTGFPSLEPVVSHLNRQTCVESYFDFIMQSRVVFIEPLNYRVMDGGLRFQNWLDNGYEGLRPTLNDFQTHLSLLFPEVRARGFMELRSMDCQPRSWQVVPAMFYTALLYDKATLNSTLELLLPLRARLQEFWRYSVYGLHNEELASLSKKITRLALDGLTHLPACFQGRDNQQIFQRFVETFTEQGQSPADAILRVAELEGRLTPASLLRLEEQWQGSLRSQ